MSQIELLARFGIKAGHTAALASVSHCYGAVEATAVVESFVGSGTAEGMLRNPLCHVNVPLSSQVVSPFSAEGVLSDWDMAARMWDYALR